MLSFGSCFVCIRGTSTHVVFRISAFDFARVGTASGPSSWRRKEAAKNCCRSDGKRQKLLQTLKAPPVHDQHQNIRSLQSCFQHTAAPTSQTELKHFGNLKSDVPKCLPSAISTRRAKSNQLNFPSNFPNTFLWSFPRSRLEGLPPLSGCSRNQPRLVKSKQNNNHFFHDAIDKTHISSRLANPIFRSSISLLFRCFCRNHHHIT